jgi:glutamine synthetase
MIAEYIWIGGNGELRSKTRVLPSITSISDIPNWNYDGSSTHQATTESSEVDLIPVKLCKNPLMQGGWLVLCETYANGHPHPTNHRHASKSVFSEEEESWFGLEQEYFMVNPNWEVRPSTYCGIGHKYPSERKIVEEHLRCCIDAGLTISGLNAEVAQCQWEFQIGPCVGIDASDQLYIARFLLERIAENYNVTISYHPKPLQHVNGSGCHTNFSTRKMREADGLTEIYKCMEKLEKKHEEHMLVYGKDNEERLTGFHETASYKTFSYGVGTRNTSIRIGNQTFREGKGYFEDRRPAANMDPYLVTAKLYDTCINKN